jgi:cytochrome c biogenesis protein CcmG/thiol:disulfide interchange protein DsbE
MTESPSPQATASTPSNVWTARWVPLLAVVVILAAWPMYLMRSESGPPAPGLSYVLQDMNGKAVNLEDFRGRPILLNFWATWCPPCKTEVPWFVEFADKYFDQDLAILGVSIDDEPEDIRKFAAEYKVNYPMLVGLNQKAFIEAYEASVVVPVSWLIRPNGEVLLKVQGIHPKEWFESQIQTLVGEGSWW